MKKLLIFLLMALMVAVSTASAQVTVNRDLPDSATVGEEITVTLSIKIGSDKPAGAIIEENIPDGFAYVSSSSEATKSGNTLKWAFYGSNLKDMEVKYTLKAEKAGKAEFEGTVTTLLGVEKIGGDNTTEVIAKAEATKTSPQEKGTPGFEVAFAVIAILGALAARRF